MSMKKSTFDAVIVGGGAAGLFAAVQASARGRRILLLEKNSRCGKKLLITGKGRCNVTNACTAEEALKNIPRNGRFLYSAMAAFPPEAAMAFFEQGGCPLKVERGNRVFPVSDRSADILNVLERALQHGGVERRQTTVTGLSIIDGTINGVLTADGPVACGTVLLCTGGASYPLTGSTGDGYRLAEQAGHTIQPPCGSLVPLVSPDEACAEMQGLSLRNTGVQLRDEKGKTVYQDFGELLFTHFGVSGPTVPSSPRAGRAAAAWSGNWRAAPGRCRRAAAARGSWSAGRGLPAHFPCCGWHRPRDRAGSAHQAFPRPAQASDRARGNRTSPASDAPRPTGLVIPISGTRPVEEAIITRGGVSTKEIDPRTMASKLVHGLYFAGELIDCDAYTGGFNLQIAWATAHAAAQVL